MIIVLLWIILACSLAALFLSLVSLSNSNAENRYSLQQELKAGRDESRNAARELREEVAAGIRNTAETLSGTLGSATEVQQKQLEGMTGQLKGLSEGNQSSLERVRNTLDKRVSELQEGNQLKLDRLRRELTEGLVQNGEKTAKALETIRQSVDKSVKDLQNSNEKKLDEMRKTVDEKLHDTLEKRLGESFRQVSERLEAVHKGLGEMQNLATGVGDLQRVLTNVKARGTWAEYQLGAILEQVLTADQYSTNVAVNPESSERVEFAIRLPGPKNDPESLVWLPVDSKFPQEDYIRLQEASDSSDSEAVKSALKALEKAVRNAAKDISQKYVSPPHTTDFGIMFLATEGLYAEIIRRPTLVEELQRTYRVIVAGPTTITALLSSLRMGFQTLAIEKRASEVWKVLGAVKTEFGKFGDVMDKVKKQLGTVSNSINETGRRTKAMERKLREVESLPESESRQILSLPLDLSEE
ncbi:DNA recombination protein RmuC [Candidatus Fermentibacteria bacterium]|nr:MAG: DNA recombination protein RmuC [Candidatus Fermentibacteria bacterium]